MSIVSFRAVSALLVAVGVVLASSGRLSAQAQPAAPGVTFQVRGPAERLEMTVNTSRVLEFQFEAPKMMVNNPDLERIAPISSK